MDPGTLFERSHSLLSRRRDLPRLRCCLLVLALSLGGAPPSAASLFPEVSFEENLGQFDAGVLFATRAEGFAIVAYLGGPAIQTRIEGEPLEFRLRFQNGNSNARPIPEEPRPGHVNYYRGSDPGEWQTGVRRYGQIRYPEIYPGIDAVLHDRDGRVELDFEVAPASNPDRIRVTFEGADRVNLRANGQLALVSRDLRFELSAPEIYQRQDDLRQALPGRYHLTGRDQVRFEMADHDASRELIIDPVFLGFSTRLGGAGEDRVSDVATDSSGNIYLTGTTDSTTFGGTLVTPAPVGVDVYVAKLDPTGQNLLYVSFFGGDNIDTPWAIDADASGNAYVGGYTLSSTFPTLNAYRDTPDNVDAFVLKLDPSGALSYGTLYGGAEPDAEFNGGIAVHEASGRIYIGSRTDTTNLTPVAAFSDNCPNAPCPFVAGFDPNETTTATLVYATYVSEPTSQVPNITDGGALDLDVDANEFLYVFGFLNPAAGLVVPGQGFLDTTNDTLNNDHFLVKLDPSLTGAAQRVYSTFIGGLGDETERGRIVALDSGVVYVGSKTDSTAASFPVLNAVQPTNAGGEDGYVAKIDTTLAGPASQLWTTFIGSPQSDDLNAVAVDAADNVWIMATVFGSASATFPQVFPLPGSPAFGIDDDAVVAQISADGTAILFAGPTIAGSGPQEQGIAVQPSGRVILAGTHTDANFPIKGGLPLMQAGGREIAIVGLDPTGDLGLALDVSATSDPSVTGETFAYQYRVRNRGVADAANATLVTDFPAGLSVEGISGNCSFPGATATCDFFEDIPRGGDTPVYVLASAAVDGSYGVNATVTSDLADPSPGDDSDSGSVVTNATGSFPASLTLADFDVVAPAFDTGGFALDTARGVLATPNGTLGDVVNLMINDAALAFHIEELLGQGEVAFGWVDNAQWTPSAGDGEDLFGRDFNASADRVFGIVDAAGNVELRSAAPFSEGRVVATGRVPLGRPGLLSLSLTPTNAEILFDGFPVAAGDPFTTDFRDANPANVGDDFVLSIGFGTEDRGAAILNVPEPGVTPMLVAGLVALLLGVGRGRCAMDGSA